MILFNPQVKLVVYADSQSYEITGLYMDFEIKASTDKELNKAKISVYNLSEKTRNLFSDSHQAVEFYAGYGDNTVLIFSGETSNALNEKSGTEWRTDIYAGAGLKSYETKYFSKTYAKGSDVKQIFKDMASAYGMASYIEEPLFETKLLGSVTYAGRVKDVLTKACQNHGMSWSVQRGVLEIIEDGNFLIAQPTAVVLSPSSGMIGAPSITNRSTKGGKNKKAVRVVSLLNPDITPGRLIQIDSTQTIYSAGDLYKKPKNQKRVVTNADGIYIAQRLRYYGNNYGGPFQVEIEADLK